MEIAIPKEMPTKSFFSHLSSLRYLPYLSLTSSPFARFYIMSPFPSILSICFVQPLDVAGCPHFPVFTSVHWFGLPPLGEVPKLWQLPLPWQLPQLLLLSTSLWQLAILRFHSLFLGQLANNRKNRASCLNVRTTKKEEHTSMTFLSTWRHWI